MKIWRLLCKVNNFECLKRIGEFDLEFLQSFDGRSKVDGWKPLKFEAMDDGKVPWGDIAGYHSHIPIVTQRTIEVTRDLFDDNVEILPVFCEGKKWYLLNVTKVLDCIDYTKSVYKTITPRLKIFDKYVFKEEIIGNNNIFKLKDFPLFEPFVTDEFRQRIIDNRLKGFKFELAWDSEAE